MKKMIILGMVLTSLLTGCNKPELSDQEVIRRYLEEKGIEADKIEISYPTEFDENDAYDDDFVDYIALYYNNGEYRADYGGLDLSWARSKYQ